MRLVDASISGNGAPAREQTACIESSFRRERSSILREMLVDKEVFPLWDKQILEIACGRGDMLQTMLGFGALEQNFYGIERLPRRVGDLRKRFPEAHLFCEPVENLAFHDARFDVVICSLAFSAITNLADAHRLVREIRRILQPGGVVVWYDVRYQKPRDRRVRALRIRRLRNLFQGCEITVRSCTLLPPIARRLGRFSDPLYPVLSAFAPFRSHYTGLIIPA